MHVHVSALDALIVSAYVVILMFFMRMAAVHWGDRPVGKALSFIH